MKQIKSIAITLLAATFMSAPLLAQEQNDSFKEQFIGHFNYANRVIELAKAVPAEKYSWRPEEGVMSIEEVYVHIAQYNYYYLVNTLNVPAPEGVDLENMDSITGKENIIDLMESSVKFVNSTVEGLTESELMDSYELYGRTVNGEGVLFQLITHLSEHVGQSISYARMNGITPPWSQ